MVLKNLLILSLCTSLIGSEKITIKDKTQYIKRDKPVLEGFTDANSIIAEFKLAEGVTTKAIPRHFMVRIINNRILECIKNFLGRDLGPDDIEYFKPIPPIPPEKISDKERERMELNFERDYNAPIFSDLEKIKQNLSILIEFVKDAINCDYLIKKDKNFDLIKSKFWSFLSSSYYINEETLKDVNEYLSTVEKIGLVISEDTALDGKKAAIKKLVDNLKLSNNTKSVGEIKSNLSNAADKALKAFESEKKPEEKKQEAQQTVNLEQSINSLLDLNANLMFLGSIKTSTKEAELAEAARREFERRRSKDKPSSSK